MTGLATLPRVAYGDSMRSHRELAQGPVVVPRIVGRAVRCEPQSNKELLLSAHKLLGSSLRSLADLGVRQQNSESLD